MHPYLGQPCLCNVTGGSLLASDAFLPDQSSGMVSRTRPGSPAACFQRQSLLDSSHYGFSWPQAAMRSDRVWARPAGLHAPLPIRQHVDDAPSEEHFDSRASSWQRLKILPKKLLHEIGIRACSAHVSNHLTLTKSCALMWIIQHAIRCAGKPQANHIGLDMPEPWKFGM